MSKRLQERISGFKTPKPKPTETGGANSEDTTPRRQNTREDTAGKVEGGEKTTIRGNKEEKTRRLDEVEIRLSHMSEKSPERA